MAEIGLMALWCRRRIPIKTSASCSTRIWLRLAIATFIAVTPATAYIVVGQRIFDVKLFFEARDVSHTLTGQKSFTFA